MAEEEPKISESQRRRIEAEFLEQLQCEVRQFSVADHLSQLLVSLSSMAFQYLGLTEQTRTERDLTQSRLAIDAFKAITDLLVPLKSAQEVSLYRSTLAQMQMAFVSALQTESTVVGKEENAGEGDRSSQAPSDEAQSQREDYRGTCESAEEAT